MKNNNNNPAQDGIDAAIEDAQNAPIVGRWVADKDNWIRDEKGALLMSISAEWRTREEVYAIRDLAAAAPDMLEALIEIQKGLSTLDASRLAGQAIATARGNK